MISLSLIIAGFFAAGLVNKRISLLSACISLLKQFSADIGYCGMPVDIMIKNALNNGELMQLNFLQDVNICNGDDFYIAWKKALEKYFVNNPLLKSDIQLLETFGERLGTSDCVHQKKLCDEYIHRFNVKYEDAVKHKDEYLKLCKSGGVVAALLFLVLLV